MHTAILCGFTLNIDKLIQLVSKNKIIRRSLKFLEAHRLRRDKRSGFSKYRYQNTNLKYPIIISTCGALLDGRHRLAKMYDNGRKYCYCRLAYIENILECIIK